ncbi:MAG: S9 family peptidase [Gemmatimonadales bacterium]|nr:MAG: S9 family peptidase [Gemmatimonadales bacterium]
MSSVPDVHSGRNRPQGLRRALVAAALLFMVGLAHAPDPVGAQERGLVPRDYYGMTFVGEVAISPDGEMVAFTQTRVVEEENRRHREVWMVPLENGEPAGDPFRFTDPTREAWAPRWSPDGRTLAFQSRRDDESTTWFARVEAPGGEAYRIPGVEGAPIWSPDGRWIAFVDRSDADGAEPGPRAGWIAPDAITVTENRERFDGRVITQTRYKSDGTLPLLPHPGARGKNQVFVVPAEGGEPRQLTHVDFNVIGATWSPDGRWIAFSGNREEDSNPFLRRSELFLVRVDGGTGLGELRELTPGEESAYRAPAFSPDGNRLAYLVSPDPNTPTRLEVRGLGAGGDFQGEAEVLVDGQGVSPGAPSWRPDGAAVRFTAQDRGSVHLFQVGTGAGGGGLEAVTSGERQVGSVEETVNGAYMAYTSTDPITPDEIFVARADGSGEQRLTGFNDGWLAEVSLRPAERLVWTAADGTEVDGWVIPPVNVEPGRSYPMVLKIHGGPNSMYGHTFFQTFHVLSNAGFYVLYPNPRGSSGYGHEFMMATRGYWGLMDEEDFLTGVDAALAAYPQIDPSRIGVSGGSYGGYATNWLTARSDRFAAAVTSRSIVSLETLWGTSDSLGTLEWHFFGTPWDAADTYRAASPITYVGNVTAPTLIIHSEEDHRTPMQDGEMWYLSLKRLGVPVEFVRYPRSSHGLSRTGEPWLLVDRLVRLRSWFDHWLGDAVTDGL